MYELNIKDNIIIDHRVIDNNLFFVGYEYITIDEEDPRPEISLLDGTETNIGYNDIYYFEDTPVHGMTKIIGLKLAADPQAITFNAKGFLGANYGYKQVYVSQTDLYLCDSNWLFTENSYYSTLTISQFELNIKLYPVSDYYTSKNNKVYLREYHHGVFVVFNLTKKDIDIKISKTIRAEKDLSNLIKIIKKAKGLR